MATNFNVDSRYVADEQRLFLVGGRINGGFFTNMVEIYNMITHQWSYGPTMNYKRTISGVVIDPITTHLYAIGGFGSNDTHDNVYLDSIEYMNITALDQWSFVPSILPTGVSDTTAVLYKQLIYIIGSGKNAQHAIYTLDPANNVIESMDGYLPYRIFNAVVFKDVLYAFGGMNSTSYDYLDSWLTLDISSAPSKYPSTAPILITTEPVTLTPTYNPLSGEHTSTQYVSNETNLSASATTWGTYNGQEVLDVTQSTDTVFLEEETFVIYGVVGGMFIFCCCLIGAYILYKHSQSTESSQHSQSVKNMNKNKRIVTDDFITNDIVPEGVRKRKQKDVLDLQYWFDEIIGLPQYFDHFINAGYESINFIKEIQNIEEELVGIGIEIENHRMQIYQQIKKLKGEMIVNAREEGDTSLDGINTNDEGCQSMDVVTNHITPTGELVIKRTDVINHTIFIS
eukprot:56761_1